MALVRLAGPGRSPYLSAMSASAQKALNKAIRDGGFAPVYYLHGDDDFLKDDAVKRLVKSAVDPATRDFNLEIRRAADLDAETLDSLLGTPPMMAERRVVVLRDVAGLKKDARQALDRYLARPASDLVLVLVAVAGGKADKALCDKATAVEFEPLTGDRVPKWIVHHAEAELGASITPEAVTLLQEAVGSDLPTLCCELEKLASYANGRPIDEDAVTAIVGVRRGETLSDLLDAIAARETRTALGLVEHVLAQPKTSAVSIVMALTVQTLALAWGRARFERGSGRNQLSGEFFSLLKETGAFPMRPWGEAASAWTRYVERWTLPQLDRALDLLLAADVALKETRLSTDEQLLATLVLSLCAAPAARAA